MLSKYLRKKWQLILSWFVVGIPVGLSAVETITYPGSIYTHLGIHLYWLIPFWLMMTIIICLILKRIIWPEILNQLITYSFIIVTLLLLIATLTENYLYPNYFFANVGINPLGLFYVSGLLLAFGAIASIMRFKISTLCKKLITIGAPIAILIWAYYFQSINYAYFRWLVQEDGLVEIIQVILLLFASYFSLRLFKLNLHKKKIIALIMGLAFIGFFFIAGEEISWGQRIFNWSTPDHYAVTNIQGETNIHNNQSMFGLSMRIYIIIGLYGSFAWITIPLLKKHVSKSWIKYFVPESILMPYFLPSLAYNYYRVFVVGVSLDKWEEITELLLYLAITLHLGKLYRYVRGDRKESLSFLKKS